MRLSRFRYTDPKTVVRAVAAQKTSGKFLAGGTDLFVAMKEKTIQPDLLVDLGGISRLKGVKRNRQTKELRIGALTTLSQLQANSLIQKHIPALSQIIPLVSTWQLRNMGTLGGNLCLDTRCCYYNQPFLLKQRWEPCLKIGGKICHLVKGKKICHAVYSGDLAAPLIALGTKVRVAGEKTTREVALNKFFTGSGIKPNILKHNEILTEVCLPELPARSGLSYQKLRLRDTVDFPLLGVALFLQLGSNNEKCRMVRLVLNAVGPAPVQVEEARELMRGKRISTKLIDAVAAAARKQAHPVDNVASSPGYRREMIPLFISRAFDEAWKQILQAHKI
jgi:4-hydroxybenzoyl-CoA reductase subunit beta